MKSYRWLNDKKSAHPMQETQETWVRSLVQEDPLEEEMATHSSILAWKIPWTEETGGLQSVGSQSWRTERLSVHAPSPARRIQEMQVRSLVQEDPLEEGMTTDSYILAWRIPETEGPGGLQSIASQRVGHH